MNRYLTELMDQETPKVSPIAHGIAEAMLERAVDYLDANIRSGMEAIPKDILEYEGYAHVSPDEWFNALIKRPEMSSRPKYDTSKSNFIPYKFKFIYMGKRFVRYLYIMYAIKGNILIINNTKFPIMPILTDSVISMERNSLYLRLSEVKDSVYRMNYPIKKNGERYLTNIIWFKALQKAKKPTNKEIFVTTPLILFTIGEYGLAETLKMAGLEPETDFFIDNKGEDVKGFIRFSSENNPSLPRLDEWKTNNINVYIRESKYNDYTEAIANTLVYITDVLSSYQSMIIKNGLYGIDVSTWRLIIARLSSADTYNLAKAVNEIEARYKKIKYYLDSISRIKLKEIGIECNDFYDLVKVMILNFKTWTNDAKKGKDNFLTTRYLDVLYYLLFSAISGFNNSIRSIISKHEKAVKNNAILTIEEINGIFTTNLQPKTLLSVNSGSFGGNIAIGSTDSSVDLKYPKMTSPMELQEGAGKGVQKGSDKSASDNLKYTIRQIAASHMVIGSVTSLPKARPSGVLRANLFVQVDSKTGRFIVDQKRRNKCEIIDYYLKQVKEGDGTDDLDIDQDLVNE